MKKLLMSTAMAAMFGAMIPAAQAVTLAAVPFSVTVSLTSVCTMAAFSGPLVFPAYTAFTATATTATSTSSVVSCTRGLTGVTAIFDDDGGVDKSTSVIAISPTGQGVVAGLNYTMTATRSGGNNGTAANATGGTGTADTWTYTVTGGMAAGQAGCVVGGIQPANCATTQGRTLTVTY